MEHPLDSYVREIVARIGFADARIEADEESRKGAIELAELELESRELQEVVESLNHLVARYAERVKRAPIFFDINGYRAAREDLIVRLAEKAAERVRESGTAMELPPMNSYERRLVHARVGDLEGVRSESAGTGRERRVTILLIEG